MELLTAELARGSAVQVAVQLLGGVLQQRAGDVAWIPVSAR